MFGLNYVHEIRCKLDLQLGSKVGELVVSAMAHLACLQPYQTLQNPRAHWVSLSETLYWIKKLVGTAAGDKMWSNLLISR